ncbi:hypothetical protein [Paraconexibacter algicola]|uniref:Uncharacterized protein n=1 Tax=Paraconexibacter algicola TaxID=2133960 RepID=A0A2T4UE33_9ACTN|nr:hypothetical protein [Paraconexibacter algicola]PTL55774.1 hypothetical protein C7Y72_19285 [Paraconexibacter algicola]
MSTPDTTTTTPTPGAALAVDLNGGHVFDPVTGEAYEIADAPPELLARYAMDLGDLARQMREARAAVEIELANRLRYVKAKSLPAGPFLIERKNSNQWNADACWQALSDLVAAGKVGAAEAADAMPESTVRKPDGRKLNALLTRLVGEDPEAAGPLARARVTREGVRVAQVAVDATAEEVDAR